jgi:hypothetical protein
MEVSGQLQAPPALPLEKQSPVTIVQEVGWAPEPFWTIEKKKSVASARDGTRTPQLSCTLRNGI